MHCTDVCMCVCMMLMFVCVRGADVRVRGADYACVCDADVLMLALV